MTKKTPTIAFEKKYDVIYGNYVVAYLERTGLIKTEHWFLNPKTILAFDKCLCCQGTSKNWKELVESVLCCIYFCFLHGDALQPGGKNTTCLPSSLFFHLSICISYLEGKKKKTLSNARISFVLSDESAHAQKILTCQFTVRILTRNSHPTHGNRWHLWAPCRPGTAQRGFWGPRAGAVNRLIPQSLLNVLSISMAVTQLRCTCFPNSECNLYLKGLNT